MNDIIRRSDPFDIFNRFGELLERDPFFGSALAPPARSEWLPPVDIRETENAYVFEMDVPGLKPEDLDVELSEGVLTVRGSRSEEHREEDKGYIRSERRQGSFTRQFRVPSNIQADALKAEVKNGVLMIEVPKGAEPGTHKVKVN